MKLSHAILAIVTIILIILITLLIHIDPCLDVESVSFNVIKGNLKTGDIIIMFGNTLKSAGVRWYIQSPASHVGMIVKLSPEIFDTGDDTGDDTSDDASTCNDNRMTISVSTGTMPDDNLYVLDIGPHSFFSVIGDRDVKLRPLSKVLKSKNCISTFGIVPVDTEIALTPGDIIEYASYNFDLSFPFATPQKITKYKICSTFVSKIHEDKGMALMPVFKDPSGLTPKDYFDHDDVYFFHV